MNVPSHPYSEFEGSRLWRTIDGALFDLEQNQDLELRTSRKNVVGYLCKQLSPSNAARKATPVP